MTHIMIDFETLDTRASSAVLSLGAVKFTKDKIGPGAYYVFDLNEQIRKGRTVSGSTLSWWMQQDADARAVFEDVAKHGMKLDVFLEMFPRFCGPDEHQFHLWGNGADFDIAILSSLYENSSQPRPWRYSNARCYRTLNKIYGLDKGEVFSGIKHNALDDAIHQAKCLQKFLVTRPE